MASIASLTVDLALQTASFSASAKKVQSDVSSMKGTIEGFGQSLETARGFLEKLGIALGLRELVEFGKSAVETAANLGEMAERAGLTVGQLQGLEFAALKSGESIEGIDTAITRLTRTVGEASEGNKKAIDTFNRLGIGVLDANNNVRSTADIFAAAVRAIGAISSPAQRAAAEVALFGKSGQGIDGLIQKLAEGKISLEDAAKAAEAAGFAFSDKLVEEAKQAEAQIEILRREAEVFAVTWGGEFLKALEDTPNRLDDALQFLNRFRDLLYELNDEAQYMGRSLRNAITGGAVAGSSNPILRPLTDADLAGSLNDPRANPPHTLTSSLGGGAASAGGFHNPVSTEAASQVQKVVEALKLQLANLQRTDEEQLVYNELAKAGVTANSAAGKAIAGLAEQLYEQKAALTATNELETERVAALKKSDDALAASFTTQKDMADQAAQRQVDIQNEISDNQALIEALGQGADAYAREAEFIKIANAARQAGQPLIGDEIAQAHAQAATIADQTKTLSDLQQRASDVQSTMDAVGQEFVDGVTHVKTWGEAAKAALGDVLKLILKILAQQISGGGGLGGLGGGGGGGSGSFLGDLFGSLFGSAGGGGGGGGGGSGGGLFSFLGFASGGDAPGGVPITVGERGPERLILPRGGGRILPHDFAGGGMTFAPTTVIDARGSTLSEAQINGLIKQGNQETFQAVFKAMDRGGNFSRTSGRRPK